jgi:hypothetical protein
MTQSEIIEVLVSGAIAYGAALLMWLFLRLLTRDADADTGAGGGAPPGAADVE